MTNLHFGNAITTIGQGTFIFADGSVPENLDIYISTLVPPTLGDNLGGDMFVSVYSSARNAYQTAWAGKGIDAFAIDETLKLQNKAVTPSTSAQSVSADSPFVGLDTVSVAAISLQSKTATPTTSAQTISADSGYNGLSGVTISAVDSSIDANITAGNIKNGVSILGVTGTYQSVTTQSLTQAEYDALATKDPNIIYLITD